MKTYYFLAGLPRSGNTLLSSILNQNPMVYSSPLSPVSDYLTDLQWANDTRPKNIALNDKQPMYNVLQNIANLYYKDIDKPIIIDRSKDWGVKNKYYFASLYLNNEPKILFTVRPILEILTSFITILPENSYVDIDMKSENWGYKNYLTLNDNRCDYLMRPNGQIDSILLTINEIIKEEYKNNFCLIEYDKIINTPQEVMDKIYNFFEMPNYKHNFDNIEKVEIDDDVSVGLPPNMHKVRPQIKKISQDPKEVLSEYVINKYSNIGWGGL